MLFNLEVYASQTEDSDSKYISMPFNLNYLFMFWRYFWLDLINYE